ncbi:hypothetical protein Pcinc_008341 [Petrolisthes cinctipes]|uniref:Uncharacterized protein n=1 Tax=Petrolisthes cinctipes TaxID=88211 RepID=A0AAE1G7L8_PETCI|nr:hypothetical protein Pcinc_008341 [Petrolisthes cinctipes]
MADIGNGDDPTAELRGARVRHDNTDVRKVIRQIQDTCNPFTAEWKSPHYAHLIEKRHINLSYLSSCFHFYVIDGQIVRELVKKLVTNHKEVDTLIAAHAKSIDQEACVRNIVLRRSDIAVILLHHW